MKKSRLLFLFLLFVSFASFSQSEWKGAVAEFGHTDSINNIAGVKILFVGSSTFRMWDSIDVDFAGYNFINRGFGGSKLRDVLYWFDDLVVKYKPKQIIVYEGDNDFTDVGYTSDDFMSEAALFTKKVREVLPKTEICWVSVKPSPSRARLFDKYKETALRMKTFCRLNKRMKYIDTWSYMFNDDGTVNRNYFSDDMLHMNRQGYLLWADIIRPYLKK